MNHRRFHWLEKIQVELATLVALAAVYFLVWPHLRPDDPEGPVTFVSVGGYGHLAAFALIVWVLAAAAAVVTIHSRPEGAMLAAFIGAGGVSLHSPSVRPLLWLWQDRLAGLYGRLILEVLLLAAVLAVAAGIVLLVRRMIAAIRPGWIWRSPVGAAPAPAQSGSGRRRGNRDLLARSIACLLLGMLIAVILLLLLMRSGDRGQALFALLMSFVVGVMVAHQVFPSPYSVVAWTMPVATAIVFYVLFALSSMSGSSNAWTRVPFYAYALPIDWMTVGAGGALLGFWISQRIHEIRHFEKLEDGKGT